MNKFSLLSQTMFRTSLYSGEDISVLFHLFIYCINKKVHSFEYSHFFKIPVLYVWPIDPSVVKFRHGYLNKMNLDSWHVSHPHVAHCQNNQITVYLFIYTKIRGLGTQGFPRELACPTLITLQLATCTSCWEGTRARRQPASSTLALEADTPK